MKQFGKPQFAQRKSLKEGHFQTIDNSDVHRFLPNEQSLLGADAYYFDLAEVFARMSETKAFANLNFRVNPRWGIAEPKNTIELNQRFDWILLKNPYPAAYPVAICQGRIHRFFLVCPVFHALSHGELHALACPLRFRYLYQKNVLRLSRLSYQSFFANRALIALWYWSECCRPLFFLNGKK